MLITTEELSVGDRVLVEVGTIYETEYEFRGVLSGDMIVLFNPKSGAQITMNISRVTKK